MSDLEVKQQLQLNTQQPTENGSQQVQKKSPEGKPTIFVGMTEAQAKEQGLLDQFNKANTDGDGTISDKEYASYINNQNNTVPSSKSGKRTAQGGIYTVQKGDSLSLIAQDFGLDMMDLYETNKNTIGSNINILEIGQQLKVTNVKISTDNFNTNSSNKKSKTNQHHHSTKIFYGMTREQAEKIGGETLETFNKMSKDKQIISGADFSNYKKMFIKTLSAEEKKKLQSLDLKKPEDFKFVKDKIAQHSDTAMWDKTYSNKTTKDALDILFKKHNITAKDLKEAGFKSAEQVKQQPKEFGKFVYKKLKESYDKEVSNKQGDSYRTQYERLKKGEYTDYEKEQLGLVGNLTEEQLDYFTKAAIKQKYIGTIVSLNVDTEKGENTEYLAAMVQAMSDNLMTDEPNVKAFVTSLGLSRLKGTEYEAETAKTIAADAKAYGFYQGNEEADIIATKVILETGSEDAIQTLITNNSDKADFIKEVADGVVENMPDGTTKTTIQNAVKTAIETIQSQQGGSRTSGKNETKEAPVPEQRVISQATYNTPEAERIAKIREASNSYTSSNTTNPIQSSHNDNKYLVTNDESEKLANIQKSLKRKFNDLKSKSIGQALSDVVEDFDNIPRDIQVKIKNYFKAMKPDRQCEAYIGGSETLRKFMDKETGMSATLLNGYFTKHPLELNKAPKEIQTKMEDYNKKIHKPYDKNMDLNFNNFGFSAI